MKQTYRTLFGVALVATSLFAQAETGMRVGTITVVDSTPNSPKVVGTATVQAGQMAATNVLMQINGQTIIVPVTPTGFPTNTPGFYYTAPNCSGTPYGSVGSQNPFVFRPNVIGPLSAVYVKTATPPETLTFVSTGGEGVCSALTQPHVLTLQSYQLAVRLGTIFTPPFLWQVQTY